MKDIIVLAASIMLGIAIFALIAGEDDGSIKSTLQRVWVSEQQLRSYEAY